MRFDIVTIFPEAFTSYFDTSILKRAQKKSGAAGSGSAGKPLVAIRVHNLRDYATDKHRTVDDKPYGGGAGMVLKVEPIYRAVRAVVTRNAKRVTRKVILLAAGGKQFDQRMAEKFSTLDQLVFIAGHYEGVDERVMKFVDETVSVGPYILTGGELPAMTIVDAVTRLIPGVLGNPQSLQEESFSISSLRGSADEAETWQSQRLLRSARNDSGTEYPQYTRPESFSPRRGIQWKVPKILLSGDHNKIAEWRKKRSK